MSANEDTFDPHRYISGPFEHSDATALERKTVYRLRNRGGWWEGDMNALTVLREFAAEVRSQVSEQNENPNPQHPCSR